MNFPKNASKQQRDIVYQYVGNFVEKNSFCVYLTGLIKKSCLKKFKFSSVFAPFKHGTKNKLSKYFSAPF